MRWENCDRNLFEPKISFLQFRHFPHRMRPGMRQRNAFLTSQSKYSNGRREIWNESLLENPLSWPWTVIKGGCIYSCTSAPAAKELRCTPRILPSPTGAFPAWSRWTQKSLRPTTSPKESTTNCPTMSWCCTCRWRTPPGCSSSGSPLFTLSLGLGARTTPSGTSYSCHPP